MRLARDLWNSRRIAVALAVAAVLAPGSALSQHQIRGSVIASGGGSTSAAVHTLAYTMGQSVVDKAVATTHILSSGFWGASSHATAVEPAPGAILPRVDVLHPGIPNPFNPFTTIRYDLAGEAGRVRLRIYDLRGKLVETLVDEIQAPGRKRVVWRGCDARGALVASGTYFCVLEAHGSTLSRKLVLVK